MHKETGIRGETVGVHFGTWNKFLKLMNETEIYDVTKVIHTEEELMKMYKEYSIKLGKTEYGASTGDFKKPDFPYSPEILIIRFGSMNNLRKLVGFKTKPNLKKQYTKKELKEILYKKYKEKGRKLTQNELRKDQKVPSMNTFLRYFQTTKMSDVWKEVLE